MSATVSRGYHGSASECLVWGYDEAFAKLSELKDSGTTIFECPDGVANDQVYKAIKNVGLTARVSMFDSAQWGEVGLKAQIIELGNRSVSFGAKTLEAWIIAVPGAASANVVMDWPLVSNTGISRFPHVELPTIWSSWLDLYKMAEYAKSGDFVLVHHLDSETGKDTLKLAHQIGMKLIPSCQQAANSIKRLGLPHTSPVNYLVSSTNQYRSGGFTLGIMGQNVRRKGWDRIRSVAKDLDIELVDWASGAIQWERDKEEFFQKAACVVSVADPEGGPLPPLEALARGRMAIGVYGAGLLGEIEYPGIYHINTVDDLPDVIRQAKSDWESGIRGTLPHEISSENRLADQIKEAIR